MVHRQAGVLRHRHGTIDSIDSISLQLSCSGICMPQRLSAHLAAWGLYRGVLAQSSGPPARADSHDRAVGPTWEDYMIVSLRYYHMNLP